MVTDDDLPPLGELPQAIPEPFDLQPPRQAVLPAGVFYLLLVHVISVWALTALGLASDWFDGADVAALVGAGIGLPVAAYELAVGVASRRLR